MLTPAERRGAVLVGALLALGALWDLAHSWHPELRRLTPGPGQGSNVAPSSADSFGAAGAEPGGAALGSEAPREDAAPIAKGPRMKAAPRRPIDLNRARVEELHGLPGIGPVLAGRIVDYRSRHGRFAAVEELLGVRGIGPRLLERIRPFVRV